jgi:hypothetical protein
MRARIASSLVVVALLAGVLGATRLPPAIAQDLLPTPAGQLGGREELPTAVGVPTEAPSPTTAQTAAPLHHGGGGMTMDQMVGMLQGKTGDDFDRAFIEGMIEHHQGAIDMARLATRSAKHEEIRTLSEQIIAAQEAEIKHMRSWQQTRGY